MGLWAGQHVPRNQGPRETLRSTTKATGAGGEIIFFNFNTFWKLILNLTRSLFFKLTLVAAPIALARPNACAAPCMVARQRADVA